MCQYECPYDFKVSKIEYLVLWNQNSILKSNDDKKIEVICFMTSTTKILFYEIVCDLEANLFKKIDNLTSMSLK